MQKYSTTVRFETLALARKAHNHVLTSTLNLLNGIAVGAESEPRVTVTIEVRDKPGSSAKAVQLFKTSVSESFETGEAAESAFLATSQGMACMLDVPSDPGGRFSVVRAVELIN